MFRQIKYVALSVALPIFIGLVVLVRFDETARALVADFLAPFLAQKRAVERSLDAPSEEELTRAELLQRHEDLVVKNRELAVQLLQSAFILEENRQLRRLLTLPERPGFQYLSAQVVTNDPISGGRKIRINRGAKDGVQVGQGVIANDFLYGRVAEVSNHTALVITILDINCRISIRITGTTNYGVLFGQKDESWSANPLCLIRFLPRDEEYAAGMTVETSAFGRMLPAGIPVGSLAADPTGAVTQTVDSLYKTAFLRPLDLSKAIDFVVVVLTAP